MWPCATGCRGWVVSLLLSNPMPTSWPGTLTLTTLLLITPLTPLLVVVLGEIRLTSNLEAFFEKCLLATKVYLPFRRWSPKQDAGQSTLRTLGLFPGFLRATIIILLSIIELPKTFLYVLLRELKIPVGLAKR